jgi:branched-chain amino acid transport system permease protein
MPPRGSNGLALRTANVERIRRLVAAWSGLWYDAKPRWIYWGFGMVYGQILINSILLGGIYACVAVGFSLVWGVMNILNILHGTFLMLGGYVTFWLFTLYGIDPFVSMPLAAALMFCLGYVVQRYLINLVVRAPMFITLILTFGLELLAVKLAIYFWTGDYRLVQPFYAGWAIRFGELVLPFIRLALCVLGLLMTAVLFWLLAKTRTGRAIRATQWISKPPSSWE